MSHTPTEADARPTLDVVVIYEDAPTRNRALQVCDHLALELVEEVRFNITWWRMDFLMDPHIAWDATEMAMRADMIVLSLESGDTLPHALDHWADTWADDRAGLEGALVGLVGSGKEPASWTSPRHCLLRKLAQRAGMDYLPQGYFNPDEISAAAMSRVGERATSLTPVLKDILSHSHPSTHWGLNE